MRHDETVLKGIGIGFGIAIGRAYVVEVENPKPVFEAIAADTVENEISRFHAAITKVKSDLKTLKDRTAQLPDETRADAENLIEAHLAMLEGSRLLRGIEKRIRDNLVNAEQALSEEMRFISGEFLKIDDPYIKSRIDDIEAIGNRLLRHLMNLPLLPLEAVPRDGLVFARDISPAETALLDPRKFGGIALMRGGAAGHTAIMARGLGLPAVLGVSHLLDFVRNGDEAIIDSLEDSIIINPSSETKALYTEKQVALKHKLIDLQKLIPLPARTDDGVEVKLRANMELPRDLEDVLAKNADGIGLFRTEFMFMNRSELPGEDEQYEIIRACLEKIGAAGMTIRTLDIGGDKLVTTLDGSIGDEANPALGLRAIRLALKKPALLKTQFRAILRAANHGYVRILLPLVATAEEFTEAREIYDKTAQEMREDGIKIPKRLSPLGCMIEIPAAALAADSLALVADFFALGTNDLTQYTIAIDRGNDQVAALYDSLNPAVLRLIDFSFQAATRAGIPISICGEMAGDPDLIPLLFGLGLRDFSVGLGALLQVKKRLSEIDSTAATTLADNVMAQKDRALIESLIKDFNSR